MGIGLHSTPPQATVHHNNRFIGKDDAQTCVTGEEALGRLADPVQDVPFDLPAVLPPADDVQESRLACGRSGGAEGAAEIHEEAPQERGQGKITVSTYDTSFMRQVTVVTSDYIYYVLPLTTSRRSH